MRVRAILPHRRLRVIRGFTLVELLVAISVIAILAALAMGVANRVTRSANTTRCAARMKSLGAAIIVYSQENEGDFPRSFHSGGTHREPGWAVSIAPYLGIGGDQVEKSWPAVFNTHFRCPEEKSTDPYTYSYALNVHFELDPDGDDYKGSPATWRRLQQLPTPGATILLAEPKPAPFADHLMCHQWSGVKAAKNALNHEVHGGRANYLFADGHIEALRAEDTINPARQLNRWNPSLAR